MRLVSELKRRNVFRMAALYVVVAWLLMQVAEVVMGLANLPDWIGPATLGLLAIGFPIALVFSWFYELTGQGISLEQDVQRGESITHVTGRRLDFLVISLLSAAVILLVYDKWWVGGTAAEKSIAVLPFVNMSDDPAQEYFSDGISEELLNVLAQYPGLRVAARTSSFQFKGSAVDIRDVGEKLGVNHVLEGSVRRSGDTLRITAQLVETVTGYHLWSQTFDRKLDDIFAIQDEISAAIGDALEVHLVLAESGGKASPTVRKAANTDGYDAYLQARELIRLRGQDNLEAAVTLLERALALDEAYAPAHAQLAIAITLLKGGATNYGDLTWDEVERRAMPHIERAFELDDEVPEAYIARGRFGPNPEASIADYQRALELNPSDAQALHHLYMAYTYVGRHLEAIQAQERLLELDPLFLVGRANRALTLAQLGQMDVARAMVDGLVEQNPTFIGLRGIIAAVGQGELATALHWLLESHALDPEEPYDGSYLSLIYGQLNLLPEALRLTRHLHPLAYYGMTAWPELVAESEWRLGRDFPEGRSKFYLANGLHLSGEVARAQALYEDMLAIWPGYLIHPVFVSRAPRARAAFGRRVTGDAEGANHLIAWLREDLAQQRLAGMTGGDYYRSAAMLAAMDGNEAEALRSLDQAISRGLRDRSIFSEPVFAALRDSPEFGKLESRLNAILARERAMALQLMCFENPVPQAWQPLPETCEGVVRR
jgi:TolB-like protein